MFLKLFYTFTWFFKKISFYFPWIAMSLMTHPIEKKLWAKIKKVCKSLTLKCSIVKTGYKKLSAKLWSNLCVVSLFVDKYFVWLYKLNNCFKKEKKVK